MIPKSQHTVTLRLQILCTLLIILFLLSMLPAIQFNYYLLFNTTKVDYISSNGMLSTKFFSAKLTSTKPQPDFLFSISLITSKTFGINS